jgi:hypothetical protein
MALVAPLVKKKPSYWKWMIIATHNAWQGARRCMTKDGRFVPALDLTSQQKNDRPVA